MSRLTIAGAAVRLREERAMSALRYRALMARIELPRLAAQLHR
jgi:hypothetical protein